MGTAALEWSPDRLPDHRSGAVCSGCTARSPKRPEYTKPRALRKCLSHVCLWIAQRLCLLLGHSGCRRAGTADKSLRGRRKAAQSRRISRRLPGMLPQPMRLCRKIRSRLYGLPTGGRRTEQAHERALLRALAGPGWSATLHEPYFGVRAGSRWETTTGFSGGWRHV